MKNKLIYLNHWDLLALTLIFFGAAIYSSTMGYIDLFNNTQAVKESSGFSAKGDISAIISQSILLGVAFIYLKWRDFDLGQFNIKLSAESVITAIGLFVIVALAMDLFFVASQVYDYFLAYEHYQSLPEDDITESADESLVYPFTIWMVLYALLNGFYEEIFFLGICLSVPKIYQKWAFFYSLIIRFSFHTYQGISSALGIGVVVGVLFYWLYTRSKTKNLMPFFLAHTIADLLGLGIVSRFL